MGGGGWFGRWGLVGVEAWYKSRTLLMGSPGSEFSELQLAVTLDGLG